MCVFYYVILFNKIECSIVKSFVSLFSLIAAQIKPTSHRLSIKANKFTPHTLPQVRASESIAWPLAPTYLT